MTERPRLEGKAGLEHGHGSALASKLTLAG
jgi:hypothetical protein